MHPRSIDKVSTCCLRRSHVSKRIELTNYLPLRTVLTPETNTVLLAIDSELMVEMDHANAKVPSPLLDLTICLPHIGPISLCDCVVGSVSETFRVGKAKS
jgi:hypothetical protein